MAKKCNQTFSLKRRYLLSFLLVQPLLFTLHSSKSVQGILTSINKVNEDEFVIVDGWVLLRSDLADLDGAVDAH
jgi:hypothetical protein